MKRSILISTFLFIAFALHANYRPMLAVNKQWNYMHVHISYAENPPVEEDRYTFTTTITDTFLINGQKYYVIDNLRTSGVGKVYMREDTVTQQIWIRKDETAEEQLLFKFNVAIGDTLRNITFYDTENPMLDLSHAEYKVTNVSYTEGRKTISLHASVPYNKDFNPEAAPYEQSFTWIEGVGEQIWGLSATHFENGSAGGMYVNIISLLCVQQDNELLYASDNGEKYGCELTTELHHIYSERVTCCNVDGQYVIQLPEKENILSMLLFDCQGRQVLPASYARCTLPATLPDNIYMLIIKTNKRCHKTKIIIQ